MTARVRPGSSGTNANDGDVRRPGCDVQGEGRPDVVEVRLARTSARAVGRIALPVEHVGPDRADLAREPLVRSEAVRVRVDVDQLREARVRRRAVVALEVVLDDNLPVRSHLPLVPLPVAQPVEGHPSVSQDVRQAPEQLGQRHRIGIPIHENQRAPGVDRDRKQPVFRRVEVRLSLRARCVPKAAVQVIRPRVVGALKRLALPSPARNLSGAVPAYVHEPTDLVVVPAHDDHGHEAGVAGEVLARLGDPVRDPRVLPRARKDALLLLTENRGISEPGERERDSLVELRSELRCHLRQRP